MIPTAEDLKKGSHKVIKNAGYVARVCKDVAKQVETKCRSKSLALTLGGDHSIAMGTVSGTARVYPNVGVIWVDAHAVKLIFWEIYFIQKGY
jgi:arginase